MHRQILSLAAAAALVLCTAASAQAYTGRTTNNTYTTGSSAALHTGAFYMTQAGKVASTWTMVTKKLTPFGYPIAQVTVKVKKLGDHQWKGYSAGKNSVTFLK